MSATDLAAVIVTIVCLAVVVVLVLAVQALVRTLASCGVRSTNCVRTRSRWSTTFIPRSIEQATNSTVSMV